MKTLVITGGIGSGKSLVCSYFKDKGILVYDSDTKTKELYDIYPDLTDEISLAMGVDVRGADGRLDRAVLARLVFSDQSRLRLLEGIVHPRVKSDFISWRSGYEGSGSPLVIMESAIYLEKPIFNDLADFVLLVDAPYSLRLSRAVQRDGADAGAVKSRMSGQRLMNDISDGLVAPDVDYIIKNDGNIDILFGKCGEIYEQLKEKL